MKAGIQVFEYLPSFSHQKILQVDDRAFIGSINFNHRSFLHDREIEVEIFDLKNRALLETRFLEELQESRKLELPHLSELSFFERIMSRVFLLMRYFS
jgi:cardiolipin synthase